MNRNITFVLIAVLWCGSLPPGLLAQQRSVQLLAELEQSTRLNGEAYRTAFFAEPGAGEPALICLTRNELFRISVNGKIESIRKLEKNQRANLSADAAYFIVMSYESEFISLIEVYGADGKPQFQVKPDPKAAYIDFVIGPNAGYAIGIEAASPPEGESVKYVYHLFDMTGNETGAFSEILPREAIPLSSGRIFMLHDPKSGLISYDAKGSPVWKIKEAFRSVRYSADAEWLMANSGKSITGVDFFKDGALAGNAQLKNPVRNMAVSPTGVISVATGAREIKIFELPGKVGAAPASFKPAWEYTIEDPRDFINSTAILDDGLLACGLLRDNGARLAPDKRFTEARAVLFSADGRPVWEETYHIASSNAWIPLVDLQSGPDAVYMSVQTREKIYLYRMEY